MEFELNALDGLKPKWNLILEKSALSFAIAFKRLDVCFFFNFLNILILFNTFIYIQQQNWIHEKSLRVSIYIYRIVA